MKKQKNQKTDNFFSYFFYRGQSQQCKYIFLFSKKQKTAKKILFSLLFIIHLILYYYLATLYATIIIYTYIIYIYSKDAKNKNSIFLFYFFFLFYYSYSSLIILSSSLLYFIPIYSYTQLNSNQNNLFIVTTSISSYMYSKTFPFYSISSYVSIFALSFATPQNSKRVSDISL